jgi:hypothetical protein
MRRLSACAGRPRCLGGVQRDGGTGNDSSFWTVQPCSVMPAAIAGVGPRPGWGRLVWGVQTLSTVPIRYMPCGRVRVWLAKARPRRGSAASRSRNVALSRSMSAVLITPSPCDRRRRVSTRAGVPSPPRRRSERLTTWASKTLRPGRSRGRPPCPGGLDHARFPAWRG